MAGGSIGLDEVCSELKYHHIRSTYAKHPGWQDRKRGFKYPNVGSMFILCTKLFFCKLGVESYLAAQMSS